MILQDSHTCLAPITKLVLSMCVRALIIVHTKTNKIITVMHDYLLYIIALVQWTTVIGLIIIIIMLKYYNYVPHTIMTSSRSINYHYELAHNEF